MAISTGSFLLRMSASLWGLTTLAWVVVTFTVVVLKLLAVTTAREAVCWLVTLVVDALAMLVGAVSVVVLLNDVAFVILVELVLEFLLEIVAAPLSDPNELLSELDENDITGATRIVDDSVESLRLEELGVVIVNMTSGVLLLPSICGEGGGVTLTFPLLLAVIVKGLGLICSELGVLGRNK